MLYCPNVVSPLYFKDAIFESDLNVGAECVLYVGDWNVSINPALDNGSYLHVNNSKVRKVIKDMMMTDGTGGYLEVEQPAPERLHLVSGWF